MGPVGIPSEPILWIELMSNIVAELTRAGMSDAWILRHIGMDKDELLRLKQITGLADLFQDHEFSQAWQDDRPIDEMPDISIGNGFSEVDEGATS